jgi:hypothetical protein
MAVVAAVLLTISLISPAAAAPPSTPNQSAASWLGAQVNTDGALEGFTPGVATLQGIIGLAAAGAEGPTAQRMLDAVNGDIDAAVAPFGDDDPGRLSLAILANVALGEDPTDVGGVDLVTRLQATRRAAAPDIGLYGAGDPTYDGAFRQGLSLLALASVDIDDAAGEAWLTDQQCNTGSWVAYRPDTAVPCPAVDAASFSGPDTNSTALALLGLTAGVTPDQDAQPGSPAFGRRRAGGRTWRCLRPPTPAPAHWCSPHCGPLPARPTPMAWLPCAPSRSRVRPKTPPILVGCSSRHRATAANCPTISRPPKACGA